MINPQSLGNQSVSKVLGSNQTMGHEVVMAGSSKVPVGV